MPHADVFLSTTWDYSKWSAFLFLFLNKTFATCFYMYFFFPFYNFLIISISLLAEKWNRSFVPSLSGENFPHGFNSCCTWNGWVQFNPPSPLFPSSPLPSNPTKVFFYVFQSEPNYCNYSVWPRLLLDQPATVALLIISTAVFAASLKTQKHSSLLPLGTAYPDKGLCQDLFQDC